MKSWYITLLLFLFLTACPGEDDENENQPEEIPNVTDSVRTYQ